jgi:hypothetical protein
MLSTRIILPILGLFMLCGALALGEARPQRESMPGPAPVEHVQGFEEMAPLLPAQVTAWVPSSPAEAVWLEPACPTGRLFAPELFRPPTAI